MVQVVKMTYEEKEKMYNKLTKKELIKMLIECNRLLERMPSACTINGELFAVPGRFGYEVKCTATE